MAEIKSAGELVTSLVNIVDPLDYGAKKHDALVRLVEADRAAVAARAKREVLGELRRNYWGNRDTSWEAEAQKLLTKYQTKEASDG